MNRLYAMIFLSDLICIRLFLSVSEIVWSLSLFFCTSTFSRPTYRVMKMLCPYEYVWAIIWLISGLIQFYIVYTENYHTRPAVWFAGFNSMLWWLVVIAMYLSVSWPAAISAELTAAMFAALCFIRSGVVVRGASW